MDWYSRLLAGFAVALAVNAFATLALAVVLYRHVTSGAHQR